MVLERLVVTVNVPVASRGRDELLSTSGENKRHAIKGSEKQLLKEHLVPQADWKNSY